MVPIKHTSIFLCDHKTTILTAPSLQLGLKKALTAWLKITFLETRATIGRRLGGVEVVGAKAVLTGPHLYTARKYFSAGKTEVFSVSSRVYNGDGDHHPHNDGGT